MSFLPGLTPMGALPEFKNDSDSDTRSVSSSGSRRLVVRSNRSEPQDLPEQKTYITLDDLAQIRRTQTDTTDSKSDTNSLMRGPAKTLTELYDLAKRTHRCPTFSEIDKEMVNEFLFLSDAGKASLLLRYEEIGLDTVSLGADGKVIYKYSPNTRLWEKTEKLTLRIRTIEMSAAYGETLYKKIEAIYDIITEKKIEAKFIDRLILNINKETKSCRETTRANGIISQLLPLIHAMSKRDAEGNPRIFQEKLNNSEFEFPIGREVVDIRTSHVRNRERSDYWSFTSKFKVKPDTSTQEIEAFVLDIMAGDVQKAAFMRRMCGYFLTGNTRERKIFIFWGEGNNGKSTLLALIRKAMGCMDASDAQAGFFLEADKNLIMSVRNADPNRPTPAVMMLHGKRLVVCSETTTGDKIDPGIVKKFVSHGELQSGRWLNCDPVQFENQAKLVLQTNSKPDIPMDTDGKSMWNKIVFIPFLMEYVDKVTQAGQKIMNSNLQSELEQNLPGVLKWMIQGAIEWYQNGLQIPDSILHATNEYKEENDYMQNFIAEHVTLQAGRNVPYSEMMMAYNTWRSRADNSSARTLTQNALTRELKRRGILPDHDGKARIYKGVLLHSLAGI